MNLDQFFAHWRITENPFRGEEARHDAVFARMTGLNVQVGRLEAPGAGARRPANASNPAGATGSATHADFEKIVGSLDQLSTAVVFGEKGSGKTAIRLQITRQVIAHNAANPGRKVFLIAYDDLNAFLDRLHKRLGHKDPAHSLDKIRLVDHIDALLSIGVGSLSAMVQGGPCETRRMARRLPAILKQDWLLLDAVYGSSDGGRGGQEGIEDVKQAGFGAGKGGLRRALRVGPPRAQVMAWGLTLVGWVPAATALYFGGFGSLREAGPLLDSEMSMVFQWLGLALTILWLMPMARWQIWDRLRTNRAGRRLRKQIRVLDRSDAEYGVSLRSLPRSTWDGAQLPLTETDETRYAMLARLTRLVRGLGYQGVMVLVDRVDEPTLVSGDPRRMKSIVWPMLNNKFLQQDGFALKMLLPIELRYELFRESSAFFQEARLDKQNMVERLSWTGAMLYDLCEARLNACRMPARASVAGAAGDTGAVDPVDAEGNENQRDKDGGGLGENGASREDNGVRLIDLFAPDVTVRDVVDALDQMHQPRDAFKFLYQCIAEHCSNVTASQGEWRVPRLVLEMVRKQQSERVQALQRGIRPA